MKVLDLDLYTCKVAQRDRGACPKCPVMAMYSLLRALLE